MVVREAAKRRTVSRRRDPVPLDRALNSLTLFDSALAELELKHAGLYESIRVDPRRASPTSIVQMELACPQMTLPGMLFAGARGHTIKNQPAWASMEEWVAHEAALDAKRDAWEAKMRAAAVDKAEKQKRKAVGGGGGPGGTEGGGGCGQGGEVQGVG